MVTDIDARVRLAAAVEERWPRAAVLAEARPRPRVTVPRLPIDDRAFGMRLLAEVMRAGDENYKVAGRRRRAVPVEHDPAREAAARLLSGVSR